MEWKIISSSLRNCNMFLTIINILYGYKLYKTKYSIFDIIFCHIPWHNYTKYLLLLITYYSFLNYIKLSFSLHLSHVLSLKHLEMRACWKSSVIRQQYKSGILSENRLQLQFHIKDKLFDIHWRCFYKKNVNKIPTKGYF